MTEKAFSSITQTLAEWASSLRYQDLPETVVREVKRFFLDSMGCALGGSTQHDVAIARDVICTLAGQGPSRLLVTGECVDPVSAALLNALMIRVMDYNDIYWEQDPSHPSDLIPSVLACGEWAHATGEDLILGIALAYEMEQRLCEISFPGIREVGWHHATLTAIASPIAAARMLRLSAQEMQHAIGIAASCHLTSGSVTAGKLTMMKNTVDPFATQAGVLAALLAQKGYTGPEHVLDGKEGLSHLIRTQWKWDWLASDLGSNWRILKCGMKYFPTEALTHTPISAVLDLVKQHDLMPEHIVSVTIHSLARVADILADPSKYDPHSKETADHSLPYTVAAAIVDREVTPKQFSMQKIEDPRIRRELPKIKVIADPEIEAAFPAFKRARVEIKTAQGTILERSLDYPKGDPRNPLTDEEILGKMRALADGVASNDDVNRMVQAISRMERYADAQTLMQDLVITR